MQQQWSAVDNFMISSLIPDDDVLNQVLENNKRAGLPEHDVAANQGQFLINCGILDALASIPQSDQRTYLQASSQIAKLLMPHEMGELFKVMALGRNINPDLMGFRQGEQSHKL